MAKNERKTMTERERERERERKRERERGRERKRETESVCEKEEHHKVESLDNFENKFHRAWNVAAGASWHELIMATPLSEFLH